ncbi:MAG TPA: hypothetical protein VD996_13605 [Chitinophagaceae bacterium]|nr:hypothetical protein [Chitinophagaceae bacterium]
MYSFFNILFSALFLGPSMDFTKMDLSSLLPANSLVHNKTAAKGMLGFSQKGRMIDAWYFPGTSNRNAIVIGGMHGSELSSIEVANTLIKQLQEQPPGYYNVIVIPCLFPDNAASASADPATVGSISNIGRYSHSNAADPNRQMPTPGKAFRPDQPLDHLGRTIEQENQLLLDLIAWFKPERIANIHAIRDEAHAGIYADPRTTHKGIALGFYEDSLLAVSMASRIAAAGGWVPGNKLNDRPSALYYKDPIPARAGQVQKRNTCGSKLPGNRGQGISLGTWAATAVNDPSFPAGDRAAIQLITIEFPGYKAPAHYAPAQQSIRNKQVEAYASGVKEIFLGAQ